MGQVAQLITGSFQQGFVVVQQEIQLVGQGLEQGANQERGLVFVDLTPAGRRVDIGPKARGKRSVLPALMSLIADWIAFKGFNATRTCMTTATDKPMPSTRKLVMM